MKNDTLLIKLYESGLNQEQISKVMDVSQATVSRNLQRLRDENRIDFVEQRQADDGEIDYIYMFLLRNGLEMPSDKAIHEFLLEHPEYSYEDILNRFL